MDWKSGPAPLLIADVNTHARTRARDHVGLARGPDPEFPSPLYVGQTIRDASPDEEYAMVLALWPALRRLHALAIRLRRTDRCSVAAWDELVAVLLDLDLDVGLYDVIVDGLHDAARMPCPCQLCAARAMASDAALKPHLLPVGHHSSHSMNRFIQAKYDYAGRYRVRSR